MTSKEDSQLHTPLLPVDYDHPVKHIFKRNFEEL